MTTFLFTSLLCAAICASAQSSPAPVIACNLKAIDASDRPRYSQLVKRLQAAMRERSEISNGYQFKLDSNSVTLPEVAEWISFERRCCPFLSFQISASGSQPHWLLTLTGPEGVKPLLNTAFPAL